MQEGVPPLAPSEVVVLHGDHFSPRSSWHTRAETVLAGGARVRADRLVHAALAAAAFAVHRTGAARLEVRDERLLGLVRRRVLRIVPGDGVQVEFPVYSAEAALVTVAVGAGRLTSAFNLVLGQKTANAYTQALRSIKDGLARRGLLEVREWRALGVVPRREWTLPGSVRQLSAGAPLQVATRIVREAERDEPELWAEVTRAIAASRRQMTTAN